MQAETAATNRATATRAKRAERDDCDVRFIDPKTAARRHALTRAVRLGPFTLSEMA
jgi:hypothetical protein